MATRSQPVNGATDRVIVGQRFEINPGRPLPHLDAPQAEAYACVDSRDKSRRLYALTCRYDLPTRIDVMRAIKDVDLVGMVRLVEYDIVHWPPTQQWVTLVIYEQPKGGKVLAEQGANPPLITEDQIASKVIIPVMHALTEFSQRTVTHRAIRLDNLYWLDATREKMVLGDCVTSPPGYDNGVLYEPLDLGFAMPEGRGDGRIKDDLYSLGLVVVALLRGRDFPRDMTAQQILEAKLAHSTYSLYAANGRLPLNMLELTRGLLCDDARDRWGLEQLTMWSQRRKVAVPVQPKPPKRSQRAFRFEDVDYFSAAELAFALSTNWRAATHLVADDALDSWLRRGLEEGRMADQALAAVRMLQGVASQREQKMDMALARILLILDPRAPLRYREVRVTLDGFAPALTRAALRKDPLKPFMEIIARELPKHWAEARGYGMLFNQHRLQFDELRSYLANQGLGYGIERCLYELNEYLHCQSPLIEREHVTVIEDLLPALNRNAPPQKSDTRPMDNHIAAFIAARWKHSMVRQLQVVSEPDELQATLGLLRLLAALQQRLGPPRLRDLTGWVVSQLSPIVNSYHRRALRATLEDGLVKCVRKGSLPDLYTLFSDQAVRDHDQQEFAQARAEYLSGQRELANAESGQILIKERALLMGRQVAATVSVCVAIVMIGGTLLYGLW